MGHLNLTFLFLAEIIADNIILVVEQRSGLIEGWQHVLIGGEGHEEGEGDEPHADSEIGHHLRERIVVLTEV